MFILCLFVSVVVITIGVKTIAGMRELNDDFSDYYQDFNRFMDKRAPAGSCKK